MNKYDEMLDLYIGELIPPCELLDFIKSKINMQINNLSIYETYNNCYSESILNTPVYRRTSEIFRKAFSVLENYNIVFCEGNRIPIFTSDEAI